MDVKTAFLNGDLDEEIYMEMPELPPGFSIPNEGKVLRLRKAIYGLKQAARQWNKKINDTLLKMGFTRTYSDGGVYIYRRQEGNTDIVVILTLYVDDMLIMGNDRSRLKAIKEELASRFQMTDLGEVQDFLGLDITRDRLKRLIFINQSRYF